MFQNSWDILSLLKEVQEEAYLTFSACFCFFNSAPDNLGAVSACAFRAAAWPSWACGAAGWVSGEGILKVLFLVDDY